MNFVRWRWHATGQFDPFPGPFGGRFDGALFFHARARRVSLSISRTRSVPIPYPYFLALENNVLVIKDSEAIKISV